MFKFLQSVKCLSFFSLSRKYSIIPSFDNIINNPISTDNSSIFKINQQTLKQNNPENDEKLPCIIIPSSNILLPYQTFNSSNILNTIIPSNMQMLNNNDLFLDKNKIFEMMKTSGSYNGKFIGIFNNINSSLNNKTGVIINTMAYTQNMSGDSIFNIGPERVRIFDHKAYSNFGQYIVLKEDNESSLGNQEYTYSKLCDIFLQSKELVLTLDSLKRIISKSQNEKVILKRSLKILLIGK